MVVVNTNLKSKHHKNLPESGHFQGFLPHENGRSFTLQLALEGLPAKILRCRKKINH